MIATCHGYTPDEITRSHHRIRGPPTRAHRNRPHRTANPRTARRPPQGPRTPARRHDPPPQPQPRRHRTRHPAITAASQSPARPSQPQPCLNSTPGETRPRGRPERAGRPPAQRPAAGGHPKNPNRNPGQRSFSCLASAASSRQKSRQRRPRTRRPPRASRRPRDRPWDTRPRARGPGRSAAPDKEQSRTSSIPYLRGASSRRSPAGAKSSAPRQPSPSGPMPRHKPQGKRKRRRLSGLGEKCAHPTPIPHRLSLPEPVK